MQREIPEEINIKAAQHAKEFSVKVILDYGGADTPISNDLLKNLDIISPNETELKRILNREVNVNDEKELISVIREIRKISDNQNLEFLLKLGAEGSLFINKADEITRQKAITIKDMKIVDTTGAGDCFTAAFAVKYVTRKSSIQECMSFASICAFKCITGFGATSSMPDLEEVEELLKRL